ncbi:MAG: alpha/beta fold hydrolase [Neisseriaceae bacterium]
MKFINNGVELYYKYVTHTNAKHTYIFLHGTGANHLQVEPQFNYFAKNNNVVSLDLKGHGLSSKPDLEYTIEEYAKDVVLLVKQLKIEAPIIVGSSMGGSIAIEIASSFPEIPMALVLLDSSLLYPQHFLATLHEVRNGLRQSNYIDVIKQIYHMGCLPTDKFQAIMEEILISTPQNVWQSTLSNMLIWDEKKAKIALKNCTLPMLYIAATNIIANLELFSELCPQTIIAHTVGSGHLISVEVPDQINSMIEQFTKVYIEK